ncbi:transposase [Pararhizobium sp. PWRC1-1]|uniref:transposase n=1 Tax=Pararhizobium sp. PWRC1-1 TaxID=2804566 RepID=UPI003CE74D74
MRRAVHSSRARAISGRSCSAACRLFFMAQPKPMQKPSDTGAMDDDATSAEFHAKLVQRQFAILCQPLSNPPVLCRKLAAAKVPLPAGEKRTCLALQDHQIVHKTRRHPKMPGGLPMAMAFFNKRYDTLTQRNRM